MPSTLKFALLFLGTITFYVGGFQLDKNYPRTARSLYYIGISIYGAGIFLIGQTFHLSSNLYADFLLWGIGILPLAYLLKDKWIVLTATLFFSIYTFNSFGITNSIPYWLVLIIPLLYWMNETQMKQSRGLFIANLTLTLLFIANLFIHFEMQLPLVLLSFFGLGTFLTLFPFVTYKLQALWIGSIVYGSAGIFLTVSDTWNDVLSLNTSQMAAISFTLIFIFLLFYFLKIGSLPAILITSLLIFRFYVDFSYNFMPKSLFFIIGGCLLIGFGFWFEKSRRETVNTHDEYDKQ